MVWVKTEILTSQALEEAIAFCRQVMKKSGQAHFRNDLEWVIQIAGLSAVVLFTDRDIPAFGLAFRRIRRLRFPQGELCYLKKSCTGLN
jgi:hypothetical protein